MLQLRRKHRWGADHIAHETGLAASTVQAILNAAGLRPARLVVTGRHANRCVRYQRERPGELIHVDVKKIGGIPTGGGWRLHGRGPTTTADHAGSATATSTPPSMTAPELVYSEIHHDEQAVTAAEFWLRAVAWFAHTASPANE